jgi:hypothetical protein
VEEGVDDGIGGLSRGEVRQFPGCLVREQGEEGGGASRWESGREQALVGGALEESVDLVHEVVALLAGGVVGQRAGEADLPGPVDLDDAFDMAVRGDLRRGLP